MRRTLSSVALVALCLCLASAAHGLDPAKVISQYTLHVWQTEDGLPQDALTAITQTDDGALWLGTPSGLVRFDGTDFVRLQEPDGWSPPSRYVTGLLAEPGGGLWATTRAYLLHMRRGELVRYGSESGLPPGGALKVLASEGALLLGTDLGVVRFAGERAQRVDLGAVEPLKRNLVTIAPRGAGGFWAGSEAGLLEIGGEHACAYTSRDGLPSDLVNAVLEDRAGRIWVGTSLGLAVLEDRRIVVPAAARELGGRWIRCLLEDRDGNLWIGTRGGGAFRLRDGRLETFTVEDGLPNNLVREIFEDRDGALWFVTAGGLARLTDGAVTTWTPREGLPVPFLWSVHEDPRGDLWLGTNGRGVVRLTADGPRPAPFAHPDLAGVEIRALLSDRRGRLWVGTGGNGVVEVHDGELRWLRPADGLPGGWVFSLLEDRAGRVWVGTGDGLARVEDGRVVATYRCEGGEPASSIVRALAEDANGVIWVGSGAGLARVEEGRLAVVPGAERVADARIHCVLPEADGSVWIASDGGLARLADGRLQKITAREGLPNEMLYWLLDDGVGNLWISSDVGLLRLPKRQVDELSQGTRSRLEPLLVDRSDGMRATECNSGHPAGVHRRDGTFCFPTTNGLSCVDPVRLRSFEHAPPVEIQGLLVDGSPLPVGTPGSAAAGPAVAVPSGVHRLEVRYAAIALAAPEKVVFRYQLEGFDPGWIEAGRARSAQFTRLPPGHYRFVVAARRGSGPWSERTAALALEVLPGFHQTRTFLALLLAAAGVVVVGTWRFRTRQLRQRERRLRELVEQRTRDLAAATEVLAERTRALEQANTELERLSLLDGLTRIANRRQFDIRLDAEWRRAARASSRVSLVLADIDLFKPYNDGYGHPAGDDCLRTVARTLARSLQRAEDLVARYGGEEFAILLPNTGDAECARVAERLRRAIEEVALPHPRSTVADRVTLSLGFATALPLPRSTPDTLVAAADSALYRAKADGRNRVRGAPSSGE